MAGALLKMQLFSQSNENAREREVLSQRNVVAKAYRKQKRSRLQDEAPSSRARNAQNPRYRTIGTARATPCSITLASRSSTYILDTFMAPIVAVAPENLWLTRSCLSVSSRSSILIAVYNSGELLRHSRAGRLRLHHIPRVTISNLTIGAPEHSSEWSVAPGEDLRTW